jgi:rare lipoprotein A
VCYKNASPKKEVRMAQQNLGGRLALIMVLCQLFLAFHTLPLQAAEPTKTSKEEPAVETREAAKGVAGTATYYARKYNGRRTYSGARYNPKKLTAAHATLPMGSRVRVVNPTNDREVVVTINDRCRKRRSSHIDLSRAAARELGFLGKGMTKVTIIPETENEEDAS